MTNNHSSEGSNLLDFFRSLLPSSFPSLCARLNLLGPPSAGVGRTGTFIAIDMMLRQVLSNVEWIDPFSVCLHLRYYRKAMVQVEVTLSHLYFTHQLYTCLLFTRS
ncbi:unnamed protein product [Protopolystoma xenopodis]|uniref:Tyrosine specific protein phosphatases domain-containing protein n=1 Tax=Protopolystoma xenopodis TaxID=117903 RepID=A0A3S5AZI0_9PLAT|nr:unnamed protein product [Protopolystoma xenopodis]